jgi:hypothetical protein
VRLYVCARDAVDEMNLQCCSGPEHESHELVRNRSECASRRRQWRPNLEKFALRAFNQAPQNSSRHSRGRDRRKYSSARIDNDAIIVSRRKQR